MSDDDPTSKPTRYQQQLRAPADTALVEALHKIANSPSARALLDIVNHPHVEALREVANSPSGKALVGMADSPYVRAAREIANSPSGKALLDLADSPYVKAAREMVNRPDFKTLIGMADSPQVKAIRQMANSPEMHRLLKQISEFQTATRAYVLPSIGALPHVARDIARIVAPFEPNVSPNYWEKRLAGAMRGLSTPWAIEGRLSASAAGFARIARLSDAAHAAIPFSKPVSELFASELGGEPAIDEATTSLRDSVAVAAGLQADLIAFPSESYDSIVFTAGFQFNIRKPSVPHAIEAADPEAVYDSDHAALLSTLEQTLRRLVEEKLHGIAGESWIKRRVSEPVRKRWAERQDGDRQSERPVYGQIHYADFIDLVDVITQRNNWCEAFATIFKNSDDLRVSLLRLAPVRNAIAHSRPLCRADVLLLVAEATRIFRALGSPIIS